jgi:hypothetical protein
VPAPPDDLAGLLEQRGEAGEFSTSGLWELLAGAGGLPAAGLLAAGSPPPAGTSPHFGVHIPMPEGHNLAFGDGRHHVVARFGEVLLVMIDRRLFLIRAGLASGLAVPLLDTEAGRQGLARDLLGESWGGAEEWQALVRQHYTIYGTTPPAEAFFRLSSDLAALREAAGHERGEAGRSELRKAGALLAALMSEAVADLGDLPACERWARTARQAADACGDLHTRLWVRGREVVMGLYQQRPINDLLGVAEEGVALGEAQGPPRTAAWPTVLGATAQALAVAGRREEAVTVLDRTRAGFDATPDALRGGTRLGFIEDYMIFTEGYVHTYLGDYGRADTAWDTTLRLHGPERTRSSAEVELMRSLCRVRAGDTAAGVAHARETVSRLPPMHRVHTVVDLGRKVLDAVPAQERRGDDVMELRELVGGGAQRSPCPT